MLSLNDDTFYTLKEMADLDGKPMASLIKDFLVQMLPTVKQAVEMVAKAKAGLGTEAVLAGLQNVHGIQELLLSVQGEMTTVAQALEAKNR
jgi:hypothetical protein